MGRAFSRLCAAIISSAAAFSPVSPLITLIGATTVGVAARVFESSGVRNLLIRLGKTPKRSTLEADLLKTIPAVLAEANRQLQQDQETPVEQAPSIDREQSGGGGF